MDNVHTVYEFDKLWVGNPSWLNKDDFSSLRAFVLRQEEEGAGESLLLNDIEMEESAACMKLSAHGGREILTVRNYVGTITLPSGTTIEILPKLFAKKTGTVDDNNDQNARTLVVKMLQVCGLISHKKFNNANLNKTKGVIFEVYIRLFIDEIFTLYKKGLKSGYEQKQENEKFLKGKLLFSQHIKRNFAHAERFYVEYEEFSVNRPENRLIKTTLALLYQISKSPENRKDLRRLLLIFEDMECSKHVETDFQKCTGGRNMKEYERALALCKIFLRGYTFSTYAGRHGVIALLFPMEKLFERYIAQQLEKQKKLQGWTIKSQHTGLYLFDNPKMFALRPDIYLEKGKEIILLDTKWKILNSSRRENYGISQADMYQMYAYHTRFPSVKKVILIYPKLEGEITLLNENLEWSADKSLQLPNGVQIFARFVEYRGGEFQLADVAEVIVQNSQA